MNNIAVIYMGGTFGCIGSPLTPMPATIFLQQLPNYFLQSAVDYFAASNICDSSELSMPDWITLAFQIQELSTKYQSFIIIHGTDTLHYASACLHHIFAQQLRIIFTGSQYPLLEQDGQSLHPASDAKSNLDFAIQNITQIPCGVYLGFDHTLYHAQYCYKTHTQDLKAFSGKSLQDEVLIKSLNMLLVLDRQYIEKAKTIRLVNYYNLPCCSENLAYELDVYHENPPNILILQAFGSGNLPYSLVLQNVLQRLLNTGCWVIISSQVPLGALSQHYATGSWLADLGVVFDPHYSQADLYARAALLYLAHGQQSAWQQLWIH